MTSSRHGMVDYTDVINEISQLLFKAIYEGAEAIGLTGVERHKWVSDLLHLIDGGDVRKVIRTLKKYRGQG